MHEFKNEKSSPLWFLWLHCSRILDLVNHESYGEACNRARTCNLVRSKQIGTLKILFE